MQRSFVMLPRMKGRLALTGGIVAAFMLGAFTADRARGADQKMWLTNASWEVRDVVLRVWKDGQPYDTVKIKQWPCGAQYSFDNPSPGTYQFEARGKYKKTKVVAYFYDQEKDRYVGKITLKKGDHKGRGFNFVPKLR